MRRWVSTVVETQRDAEGLELPSRILGEESQIRAQMLHQWDQRADADTRKIWCRTRRTYRRGEIGRSDPDRALSAVRQLDHHIGGATSRSFPKYRKPFAKQAVSRIRNRDVSYGPINNCSIQLRSVILR
jgi:hypothetical protein